jgi:hypothetical protein
MPIDRRRAVRGALAGIAAAGVWALQQPLDKRVLGCDYDDVELLGRLVTGRRGGWAPIGLALHLGNGAIFGAVYAHLAPRVPVTPAARGALAGLVEHVALWPLVRLTDRVHPAREVLPRLSGDRRAFAAATWRHLLFGVLLGEAERRLNGPAPVTEELPAHESYTSVNGRGDLDRTGVAPGPSA